MRCRQRMVRKPSSDHPANPITLANLGRFADYRDSNPVKQAIYALAGQRTPQSTPCPSILRVESSGCIAPRIASSDSSLLVRTAKWDGTMTSQPPAHAGDLVFR